MLVSSIFSFSHNVFYQMEDEVYALSDISFVVCKISAFNLDKAKTLSSDEGLLSQVNPTEI